MRDDNVMCIIVFSILEQAPEQPKIVIVNVKVNRSHFTQGGHKGVVNNFFMRAQFIEKKKYLQVLAYLGILHKVTLTRYRTQNADLLEVFVPFFRRVPGDLKFKAQFVDRRQQLVFLDLTLPDSLYYRIGKLQILGRRRVIIDK